MTWLTWRQFRIPAAAGGAAVAVLAAILALTGPRLADEHAAGVAECAAQGSDCSRFLERFFQDHQTAFLAVIAAVLVMPVLIGLFWGAPLIARELEAGTHRLVWNQSVTRTRWLSVKLGIVGLAAISVAGLGSLAATWWSSTFDQLAAEDFTRLSPIVFNARGIVPIGYGAFAFALGVTVGLLVRRTLIAIAITIAVFLAVQIAMPTLVRPYLLPPTVTSAEISQDVIDSIGRSPDGFVLLEGRAPDPAAWLLSTRTLDPAGNAVQEIPVSMTSGACAPGSGGPRNLATGCFPELNRLGYRIEVTYHPPTRFWPFQWVETALYAAMALALTGFCFWHLRRRHT